MEVYFKKDFMRMASMDSWVKLAEWRRIEIKNDTLHFETFGEYRDSSKAEIKYLEKNIIQLEFFETNETLNLEPINNHLNFDNSKKFWEEFHNRLISMKCIMEE
jgi:hypothetical protein